jgi:predicted ATPase
LGQEKTESKPKKFGVAMLTSIHIENFKSYLKQDLPLSSLTLMIGANASGKSNVLEAFRFLCWLAQGQKLSVLKQRFGDSEQIIRGQIRQLPYLRSGSFKLGCKTDFSMWNFFEIQIGLRDDDLHIEQESIKTSSSPEIMPLYSIDQPATGLGHDVRVSYFNIPKHASKIQISCNDQVAIMCQLASAARFEADNMMLSQTEIPVVSEKFQELLTNNLFLDPVPSLMRGESYADKTLRGDCANLSGVLYSLWQDAELRPVIIQFIKSLPEQDVKTLEFFIDRREKIALELVENFGGVERKWSVELLSDGTLRVLAIAAALLSAPVGSTVVIEEVDNGVHPSRARQLLTTMREQAEARGIRLLLSTHNPALMDALPDAALADVVFCYRDPQQGDSRLVRLADLEDYAGLVSQGPLGELVTKGIIDRFVKSPVSPEYKKQNARDWLAIMQGV